MKQLTLCTCEDTVMGINEALQVLLNNKQNVSPGLDDEYSLSITWNTLLSCANTIEKEMKNTEIYNQLGFQSAREFYHAIGGTVAIPYTKAARVVWWHRLIFPDRPINWIPMSSLANNQFLVQFNWIKQSRSSKLFAFDQSKMRMARAYWQIAKEKYSLCSLGDLHTYSRELTLGMEAKKILKLQNEIETLKKENDALRAGNLVYFGKVAKNKEVSGRMVELYVMAENSNMNSIQMQTFTRILLYQGYYPACQYIDKFEILEG